MKSSRWLALVSVLLLAPSGRAWAQDQRAPTPASPAAIAGEIAAATERAKQDVAREAQQQNLASIVPLGVQVVLSKYKGDERVSNLPYELTLRTDNERAGVRMGTQIPVPVMAQSPPGVSAPINYKDIGTNIDGRARALDAGRYSLDLTIEDTAVYVGADTADTVSVKGAPSFRTYRSTNTLVLRDGQSTQFTVATDKVSGEIIKANVTLTVLK
jgi:hypothetical protein